MLRNLRLILWCLPLLTLTACMGGGGGIDLVQLTKNPIVMAIGVAIVLFIVFKWNKK